MSRSVHCSASGVSVYEAARTLRLSQEAAANWDWVDDKENHSFPISYSEITMGYISS